MAKLDEETSMNVQLLSGAAKKPMLDSTINRISFLMFGIGMLLPYNAILAAMDFFTLKFPSYQPEFSLLVAVSTPMLLIQAIGFFFVNRIPLDLRLTLTFATNTTITFLIGLSPLLVDNEATAYYLVMTLAVLFGSSVALLQATLYGCAGPCAPLTNMLMVGIGLSGLAINALRILLVLVVADDLETSSQWFFNLSGFFLLLCTLLAFLFLRRSNFEPLTQTSFSDRITTAKHVYRRNWVQALGVVVTDAVYFSFFPGVILQQKLTFITDFSWFVIFVVTYASAMDTIGRFIASRIDIVQKDYYLHACLLRAIVFAITYLMTFKEFGFCQSDTFVVINLGLFALTYGQLCTVGMKFGSDESTGNQPLAGTIMGFHMILGICIGCTIAIAFFS